MFETFPELLSPNIQTPVLQAHGRPLLSLQLYRHEHDVTLNSPFLQHFLPLLKHCYFRTASSRPTGGSQLTSLARNARDLCYGRQTGRAAVQIGQTVDIRRMCHRSQLLGGGVEPCRGSAAGRGGACDNTRNVQTHAHPKFSTVGTPKAESKITDVIL